MSSTRSSTLPPAWMRRKVAAFSSGVPATNMAVEPLGTRLGRDVHAAPRHRERVGILLALLHRDREERKAGVEADRLGSHLVERDRVFEGGLARMWGAGEEALAGVVVAIDLGMRHPGEHGELAAVRREEIEIWTRRQSGLPAVGRLCRKEKLRHHAEGRVDRDEPARHRPPTACFRRGRRKPGEHRVEKRQADPGPSRAQERAPRKRR